MNEPPLMWPSAADDDDAAAGLQWDQLLTPTPSRRTKPHIFEDEEESDSCQTTSLGLSDSGHFSSANVSDCQPSDTGDERQHQQEALSQALQDARRLRSELQRLKGCEQWYKQELRTQKHSRLETLEKLYTNERKSLQENQRLQRECLRLYAKCGQMERALEESKSSALLELRRQQQRMEQLQTLPSLITESACDNVQRQALVEDQQQLIDVLRRQKQTLLAEFQTLAEDKDSKIFELQKELAQLEEDNQRITRKCREMITERSVLQVTLVEKEQQLLQEQSNVTAAAEEMRAVLQDKQRQLTIKEEEINELQAHFKHVLQPAIKADEIHRLSVQFHEELTQKTNEIKSLKICLCSLQQELAEAEDWQSQHAAQTLEIEQLQSALTLKNAELAELQESQTKQATEVTDLKAQIAAYQCAQSEEQEQLLTRKDLDKNTDLCLTCSSTLFELEMRKIDCGRLQFEKGRDAEEIQHLREKLSSYLEQMQRLSEAIKKQQTEQKRVKDFKTQAVQTEELCKAAETMQDLEVFDLEMQTMHQHIVELGGSKVALNEFITQRKHGPNRPELMQELKLCPEKTLKDVQETQLGAELQRMHAALELLQRDNEKLRDCVEHHTSNAHSITETNNNLKLIQKLETEKSQTTIESLHLQLQQQKQANERVAKERKELEAQIAQIKNSNAHIAGTCQRAEEQLMDTKVESTRLQTQLLKTDGQLYKLQKLSAQPEASEVRKEVGNRVDMANVNDAEERKLEKTQQQEQELCERLQNIQAAVEQIDDGHAKIPSIVDAEPNELNEIVARLEQKLEQCQASNRAEERVRSLREMLQQQNEKVQQLNSAQADWEELLQALNNAQALEAATRTELQQKRIELEELNGLFSEQNKELKRLHDLQLLREQQQHEERKTLKTEHQQKLAALQDQLQQSILQCKTQKQLVEELKKTSNDVGNNTEVLKLQQEVAKLNAERLDLDAHKQQMDAELMEQRRGKREAVMLPTAGADAVDEHLRILTKVLEGEYSRKMARYDLHIGSLLNNIKGLKRTLAAKERQIRLHDDQAKQTAKELQLTQRELCEISQCYAQSQTTIKNLEQELTLLRVKCESGQTTAANDATHEVANLIDDYKKLIQESALTSRRMKTSAILDLIQRSNKCAPNLSKLESSVQELRRDVQKHFEVSRRVAQPSLLDELNQAAAAIY